MAQRLRRMILTAAGLTTYTAAVIVAYEYGQYRREMKRYGRQIQALNTWLRSQRGEA